MSFTKYQIVEDIKFISDITVRLVQHMGGDHMVVAAARVSTSGEAALQYAEVEAGEENAGLIRYLMQQRHGTPFEHGAMTFFVHAPIMVFRQWHRHRVGFSYNEWSGRYSKLEPIFWVPRKDRLTMPVKDYKPSRPRYEPMDDETYETFTRNLTESYEQDYARYQKNLAMGISNEAARALLPVAIYSSCWVTCNPRSLMHFLSLRTFEPEATHVSYPEQEIEEAARSMEATFKHLWPITYGAFNKFGRVAP